MLGVLQTVCDLSGFPSPWRGGSLYLSGTRILCGGNQTTFKCWHSYPLILGDDPADPRGFKGADEFRQGRIGVEGPAVKSRRVLGYHRIHRRYFGGYRLLDKNVPIAGEYRDLGIRSSNSFLSLFMFAGVG